MKHKDNLKNVMREHIEKHSLSDVQLESLLQIKKSESNEKTRIMAGSNLWILLTAVFVLAIGNVFYFNFTNDLSLDEQIGNEVAKNHIKLKPLEVQTSSLQVIRKYFTELDFIPIDSEILKSSGKKLIGGRYCSIQGVTAAQLRIKDDKTGQIQSLYQTVYDPKVFSGLPELNKNGKPVTVYSKGLAVDIWVEKGLLFALTRENNK